MHGLLDSSLLDRLEKYDLSDQKKIYATLLYKNERSCVYVFHMCPQNGIH